MRDLLSAAANGGTGRRAALRTATFGKTGTTQDNRDAIFVVMLAPDHSRVGG